MVPYWFVFIAMGLRLSSGARYIFCMFKGSARPNPITWFCWALTASVAGFAQWRAGVGIQALMTFALALGPAAIFTVAMIRGRDASHFTKTNIACGALALVGIVLWQITSNPILAIVFSILADIAGSIPTVTKAFRDPDSEPLAPFLLTMAAMTLTVLAIDNWTFANYAFSVYIFCINFVIFVLAWSRIGLRYNLRRA